MATSVPNVQKTLSQMRTMVYFLTSESPTSTIFSSTNVNMALNAGLSAVYDTIHRQVETIYTETIDDVREYAIPDPFLRQGKAVVDNVFIGENALTPEAYSMEDSTVDNDEPTGFYIVNNVIGLNPTPDGVYTLTIRYRRELEPLVNDDDTTPMADIEIHAAVLYAVYLLKLKDEEFSSADRFKQEFEDALKRATTIQSGLYRGESAVTYGGAI